MSGGSSDREQAIAAEASKSVVERNLLPPFNNQPPFNRRK
jgi:hypothetical protein